MLVLSRKKHERIVIADKAGRVIAIIDLTAVESGKARLGIDASEAVVIHREEIYERIYGRYPYVEKVERLPHPAVQLSPRDYGEPVG